MLSDKVNSDIITAAIDPSGEGSFNDQIYNCVTLLIRFLGERTGSDTDDDATFSLMFPIVIVNCEAECASDVRSA